MPINVRTRNYDQKSGVPWKQIGPTWVTISKFGTQELYGSEQAVSPFTTVILGVRQLWTNPHGAF